MVNLLQDDREKVAAVTRNPATAVLPGGTAMDWTFGGLWPCEPRWLESTDGRMHYVNEDLRDGPPVVLLPRQPDLVLRVRLGKSSHQR